MSTLLLLSLYLVFFLYLMFAGAGLARALGALRTAAVQSSIIGLVIGVVVALFSVNAGVNTFLGVMLVSSLILLPPAALKLARDFILPGGSAFEVVCFNVLVLMMGGPPHSLAFIDMFMELGYHLLLNPFILLLPAWLGFTLSLWPATLALRLAAQGDQASRKLRFFLNLWMQLMSIVWLLPSAIGTLISFKAKSPLSYVEALFACLSLVYVVLTWLALRAAFGKGTSLAGERTQSSADDSGIAAALAERMEPGRWPPATLAIAGLSTYLLTWAALITFLNPQTAATVGFVAIVAAGALLGKRAPLAADTRQPRGAALSWQKSALLLVVSLAFIRVIASGLFDQRQRAVSSLDQAARHAAERITPVAAGARLCRLEIVSGQQRLHCPQDIWYLEAAIHPQQGPLLLRWDSEQARDFAMVYGGRTIHCAEIPAQVRLAGGSEGAAVMLLVYVPGAVSGREYSWVVDRAARCGNVVELQRSRLAGLRPAFGYQWDSETAALRQEGVAWLGELFDVNQPGQGADPPAD
jgi:hypothetical protein